MSEWKIVKSFSNRPEAELAKGLLENCGITAIVRSDDAGGMRPALAFSSGVQLQVQEQDLKEAQEILNES